MLTKFYACIFYLCLSHSKRHRMKPDDGKHEIILRVYDLMNDESKSMLSKLTGIDIKHVYHTSIEAYGREYWFGAGILTSKPGHSGHTNLIKTIRMGRTEIDKNMFEDYIYQDLSEKYNSSRYNLLLNNCNHFSDDALQFLLHKNVPQEILDLPKDVMGSLNFQNLMRLFFPNPSSDSQTQN